MHAFCLRRHISAIFLARFLSLSRLLARSLYRGCTLVARYLSRSFSPLPLDRSLPSFSVSFSMSCMYSHFSPSLSVARSRSLFVLLALCCSFCRSPLQRRTFSILISILCTLCIYLVLSRILAYVSLPLSVSLSLSLPTLLLTPLSHARSFYLHSVISASVFSVSLPRELSFRLFSWRVLPSLSRRLVETYPLSLFLLFTLLLPRLVSTSPHSSSPPHAHTRHATYS